MPHQREIAGRPAFQPGIVGAFENLVLLCPIHHDVIDADESAYTVDKLRSLKANHEARHVGRNEPDDSVAKELLARFSDVSVVGGSVIVSHNQVGGQVAHVINNYGPPRRTVTHEMRLRIVDVLNRVEATQIGFASTQGDMEAHEFKIQLMHVFRAAGWTVVDLQTFMFFDPRKGLVLTIPRDASEQGLPQVVALALSQTGSPVAGNRGDMANGCGLYVQVWHAP